MNSKNIKTGYVDGFVLVIPQKKVAAYKKMAREGASLWMKYGALRYRECVGDDLYPNMGGFQGFPFPKMAKVKNGETVWFSYIEYKSKKHRDQVNAKVMQEMEKKQKNDPNYMKDVPFDMKRMAFGGFTVAVSN